MGTPARRGLEGHGQDGSRAMPTSTSRSWATVPLITMALAVIAIFERVKES